MKEFHRHHPWRLDGSLYIPHEYPQDEAARLSWWDDVGLILGGRRVLVFWRHPRCVYRDAIGAQAMAEVREPSVQNAWDRVLSGQESGIKRWRKLGRSRKKVVSETLPAHSGEWRAFYDAVNKRQDELERAGIELDVTPSMRVGWCSTATTVELVAPIEAHAKDDVHALATLTKRLLRRETTIAREWPAYRYGREAWLMESIIRWPERNSLSPRQPGRSSRQAGRQAF